MILQFFIFLKYRKEHIQMMTGNDVSVNVNWCMFEMNVDFLGHIFQRIVVFLKCLQVRSVSFPIKNSRQHARRVSPISGSIANFSEWPWENDCFIFQMWNGDWNHCSVLFYNLFYQHGHFLKDQIIMVFNAPETIHPKPKAISWD